MGGGWGGGCGGDGGEWEPQQKGKATKNHHNTQTWSGRHSLQSPPSPAPPPSRPYTHHGQHTEPLSRRWYGPEAFVDPRPQAQPMADVQAPVQVLTLIPGVAPNRPTLQLLHTPEPAKLKVPAGHRTAVALVLPEGHTYPAVQFPEHSDEFRPVTDPKRPAAQLLHASDLGVSANVPREHTWHAEPPLGLYLPTSQGLCTCQDGGGGKHHSTDFEQWRLAVCLSVRDGERWG